MTIKQKDLRQLGLFLGVLVVVNILAGMFFTRIDFTKEKRYTLSDNTKEVLENLESEVVVVVYLDGELPPNFRRLKKATEEMLEEFQAYSNGKVHFMLEDPLAEATAMEQNQMLDSLGQMGLVATNLMMKTEKGNVQKIIVPGALVFFENRYLPVTLLQNRSQLQQSSQEVAVNAGIENLEYQFTSTIKKLSQRQVPLLGFTVGHDEPDDVYLYDLAQTLSETFALRRVDLNQITMDDLNHFRTLVITQPKKPFTEEEKYKLDQFVVNGGNLLLSLSQVNVSMDSIRTQGITLATLNELNLDDMLFRFGVRVNYNLLQDVYCADIPIMVGVEGQSQMELLPWVYYPLLGSASNHPIVRNLDAVKGAFVSNIDTIANSDIKKTLLLNTSPYSRIIKAPVMITLASVQEEPDPARFNAGGQNVAVLLEGKFSSSYANRPLAKNDKDFVNQKEESKIIVISDGNIFQNDYSHKNNQISPLGFDRYTNQTFANKVFAENCIDYLTDDSDLLALRSKEIKIRLLDKEKIKNDRLMWQLINTILPVLLVILLAVAHLLYRKYKYAR